MKNYSAIFSKLNLFLSVLTLSVCFGEVSANPDAESITSIQTEFIYEAHVTIGSLVDVGDTPKGKRRYIPITGGRFEGPKLKGEVLPGGADWQTERPDGVIELNAIYSMRCEDGTTLIVHNHGIISDGGKYLKTAPSFIAPEGPHAWLNEYQFIGTVSGSDEKDTVIIRVFRLL